jgi:hypothetical protein
LDRKSEMKDDLIHTEQNSGGLARRQEDS